MRLKGWQILPNCLAGMLALSGVAYGLNDVSGITSSEFRGYVYSDAASISPKEDSGAYLSGAETTGGETALANEHGDIVPSDNPRQKSEVGTGEIATVGKLVPLDPAPLDMPLFRSIGDGQELHFVSPEVWGEAMGPRDRRLILPRLRNLSMEPYTDYRRSETMFSYLPGSGDDLGWMDFKSDHYLESGYRSGFSTGLGVHLLSGPKVVDAPPRLYSLTLGYQRRSPIGEVFSYDVAASIGLFTDFEGSARDGVRFPGHAVGMFHQSPELDWVLGLDFLDRSDQRLLPVFGVSYRTERFANMRFDLVFPRPQVEYAMQSGRILYVAGRLGGDSWDMEFPNGREDVLTYREKLLLLGTRRNGITGSAVEVGYSYNRKLEFEDFRGSASPGGAFVLRFVSTR